MAAGHRGRKRPRAGGQPPPCSHCHRFRAAAADELNGFCYRCYRRWRDHGYPAGGPPPLAGTGHGGPDGRLARLEDILFLAESGVRDDATLARRLGVTRRTLARDRARARAEVGEALEQLVLLGVRSRWARERFARYSHATERKTSRATRSIAA